MNKDVIDRLAFLIDKYFPDIPFCDMQDVQGVEPPRFFITCYRSSITPRITHAGFFYTCNYDLVFDPGVEEPEELCNEMAFNLLPLILKIPKEDGKNYRTDNVYSEFDREQKVLHIFFDITLSFKAEDEDIPDILHLIKNTKVEVV